MKNLLQLTFLLVICLMFTALVGAVQQPMNIELQFDDGGWFTCPATVQAEYPDGYPFGLNNGPDPETPVLQSNCNEKKSNVVRVLVDGVVIYDGEPRDLNPHRWQEDL